MHPSLSEKSQAAHVFQPTLERERSFCLGIQSIRPSIFGVWRSNRTLQKMDRAWNSQTESLIDCLFNDVFPVPSQNWAVEIYKIKALPDLPRWSLSFEVSWFVRKPERKPLLDSAVNFQISEFKSAQKLVQNWLIKNIWFVALLTNYSVFEKEVLPDLSDIKCKKVAINL